MADVKEKINLLDVIPFRSENITAEKGSDGTVTIAFPRFKYEWMRRFLLPKGMSADIHVRRTVLFPSINSHTAVP